MSDERPAENSVEPSTELRVAFWSLVVIVDVALLATAIGALLLVLGNRPYLGGGSLAIGLLAFAVALRRVRQRRNT